MSNEQQTRRTSGGLVPSTSSIPRAPPLPAPQPLQRARDAAYRIIGYPTQQSRPSSPLAQVSGNTIRSASLSAQNATASHKTGLEINTVAINEKGTHALVGGKEIFKTIKVQDGSCAEDLNLRTLIRSTPTSASGVPRQTYSIDIADVAWAKGDCGDYVAAATSSGKIILYDLGHAGLQAAQLHEHYRQVHKVTFNPHRGNLLLSGSQDGTVRLWDIRGARDQASTLQSKRKYSGRSDGVRDVKWSLTDGVDFAFGTDSGDIQRWDIRNLKAAKVKIPAHALACNSIDWHPDGKHIISASLDKTVRVWDFSTDRKQKPAWEIKTPYPVMNARWRPPCESSVQQESGGRQCTQLVTAYTREHPVVHVWDYRRPALPFRELEPYSSAPTDLIWHSQDLLWLVGREGIFLQSDIQHVSKVIDKRNLQSFGVSSEGDVNFAVQKRRQQRVPKLSKTPSLTPNTSTGLSISPENSYISRSWVDDTLDHSFLRLHPSAQRSRSHGLDKMPQQALSKATVIALDQILNNRRSYQPTQSGGTGRLPFVQDPEVFRFLAERYVCAIDITAGEIDDSLINEVKAAFEANEKHAHAAGLYRLGQSWKITGFCVLGNLQARLRHKRDHDKAAPPTTQQANVPLQYLPDVSTIDLEENKPFSVLEMLQELKKYHVQKGDAQTASTLLTLIGPLLPRTHRLPDGEAHVAHYAETYANMGYSPEEVQHMLATYIQPVVDAGLRPLEMESIFSTYHEQLLSRRCHVEAAALRKLAYPAYPAVYEDFIKDNAVHVRCGGCGKAMVSGMEALRCESCGEKQAKCPICDCKDSPYGGGKLMTSCLLCGHGGHASCLEKWFAVGESDGACPTGGCLCDCVNAKGT